MCPVWAFLYFCVPQFCINFAYMAVVGKISQDFMTIYAVIIAFYFGTQSQKTQDVLDSAGTPQEGEKK